MANTVDIQILEDNAKYVFAIINIVSDGSGSEARQILDPATLSPPCAEYRIMRAHMVAKDTVINIYWQATNNNLVMLCPWGRESTYNFEEVGGLTNYAGAGKTGAMYLSTYMPSAGAFCTIYLKLLKVGVK